MRVDAETGSRLAALTEFEHSRHPAGLVAERARDSSGGRKPKQWGEASCCLMSRKSWLPMYCGATECPDHLVRIYRCGSSMVHMTFIGA